MPEKGDMNDLNDLLGQTLGYGSFTQNINVNNIIARMVKNTQINTLKQLRSMLDRQIKMLTPEQPDEPDSDLNPFTILGVSMDATREEIEKAYREKAKKVHPDKGGTDMDMMRVNAAYETIKQFRGWKK